ncbi:hypothetical protein BD769DRAFT_1776781 [Suillus cothurnatus]|nr:hypothetical protein BD769DRAFT_1776781 [Suillus cothurnatus]
MQQTLLLVRPWNRYDLGLPDFSDSEAMEAWSSRFSTPSSSQSTPFSALVSSSLSSFIAWHFYGIYHADRCCKEDRKPFKLGRFQVLVHVSLFRMVQFVLASSLACLAAVLSIVVLRADNFTSRALGHTQHALGRCFYKESGDLDIFCI